MSGTTVLGELMAAKKTSLDPRKTPEREFELFSIPAFDSGEAEVVKGSDIGSTKQVVENGDVLLSKIVPHIRRAWVVDQASDRPTIGSSEWIIFRSDRFDPHYLRHVLMSDRFHQAFMQTVAGIGGSLLRARPAYVADIEVPLPPLGEQRRIASILDAADQLRTKRQEAIDRLDTLIQAAFIDMFGGGGCAPVNSRAVDERHPAGWSWVPITSVAEMATGHTPDRNIADYWDGEISWINLTEIQTLDGWWCEETVARVTPEGVANSSAVILPAGTVCFSRTASIGFVTVMANPMTTSQDFVNWLCGDDLNPVFLMHSLRMARETLRASSSGSTHKTIYLRDAERLLILLPPRTLQDEYVQRVTCIEKSKAVMGSGLAPVDALFASIQQRAFRGDL